MKPEDRDLEDITFSLASIREQFEPGIQASTTDKTEDIKGLGRPDEEIASRALEEYLATRLQQIGEVTSEVAASGSDTATFSVAVVGRAGDAGATFTVQVRGAQSEACRRYLQPGHRVAVEGRVLPGGVPAEVVAERVQFLTSRAQAEQMRSGRQRAA